MKALVTGASGFIGSTLIEELRTLGFDVRALMRKTSSAANLEGITFERVEGDLLDADSLDRALDGVDYVFHLAGAVTAKNRDEFFRHNAEGTRLLAEAVSRMRRSLNRFVFVSSLAAGGPSDSFHQHQEGLQLRTEQDPDRPVSAYGESKLAAEQFVLQFKDRFPISIVRPPMVYGPRDKGVFIFVQTVTKNLMPVFKATGSGEHKYYSIIHVKDLVRGIIQSGMVTPDRVPSGEIFYLSGDDVVTYEKLMSVIADHLNREPFRIQVPSTCLKVAAYGLNAIGSMVGRSFPLNRDKLNEILPDYWVCSNEKAKRMLGFAPELDYSKGMAGTIEWYQQNRWI
jgi:nucleoside-diphosphate-sugar epimerase